MSKPVGGMPATDDEIREKYLERAIRELNHFTREDTLPGAEAAACLSIAAIDGAVPIACWRPMPRIDYDKGGWTRCLTLHSQK